MTTDLAPALAEFTLSGHHFAVDVCDAELRLTAIDQTCPDPKNAVHSAARWKAAAEYVTEISGQPCSTTQAIAFYNAVMAQSRALAETDQKKTTTPPASPDISASTPAPSVTASGGVT